MQNVCRIRGHLTHYGLRNVGPPDYSTHTLPGCAGMTLYARHAHTGTGHNHSQPRIVI